MFARLLLLFVTVPMVELVLLLKVGSRIGLPATVAIILLTGALGAWLARSQGMQILQRVQLAMAEGRIPQQEVLEGLLILVAGAVLLTPGFLTDALGFFLLIPPSRAWATPLLTRFLLRRMQGGNPSGETGAGERRSHPDEVVIEAEVISEEPVPPKRERLD